MDAGGAGNVPETWLVGDIGATNARFGLVSPDGKVLHWRSHACDSYPTIDDALAEYLSDRGGLPVPRQAAIAIASAVAGDRVAMTNHPWNFSISEPESSFRLRAAGSRQRFSRTGAGAAAPRSR